MASAIFLTTMAGGAPVLPPMTELQYDDAGTLRGGYSLACEPGKGAVDTVLVRVWTQDSVLDAMAADPQYVFLLDIAAPVEPALQMAGKPGDPPGPPVQARQFNRGKLLAYLLAHGAAADIARTFPGAVADAIMATWQLHGVTPAQWREQIVVTEPVGTPISRAEALSISRGILDRAEAERIEAAQQEARPKRRRKR